MDFIEIKGYKSIKDAKIELRPINILIGANGSGKSNFLSFFEFLNNLYERKLTEYIALNGGEDKFLYHEAKVTQQIEVSLFYDNKINSYRFILKIDSGCFTVDREALYFVNGGESISESKQVANIKTIARDHAKTIQKDLRSIKKYHLQNITKNVSFEINNKIRQVDFMLHEKGDNLAAFLYELKQNDVFIYKRIIRVIQSISPNFFDFNFITNNEGSIYLQWQDKYSSNLYDIKDLSDGTMRFIALTTLFLQPNLPQILLIDEPELGLHPFAISKLSGMIKGAAAKGTQVILATQSTDLLSYFEPDDIIAVDQHNGESVFNRLKQKELGIWLEDSSLGELWKRNIISQGQP